MRTDERCQPAELSAARARTVVQTNRVNSTDKPTVTCASFANSRDETLLGCCRIYGHPSGHRRTVARAVGTPDRSSTDFREACRMSYALCIIK